MAKRRTGTLARPHAPTLLVILAILLAGVTQIYSAPTLGSPPPELPGLIPVATYNEGRSYRSAVGNYLVLYRLTPAHVEIVRIVHGARDLTTLL